jgi:hypothetical protein
MYEIIESKRWKHTTGKTASIYGSCPYTSSEDAKNWKIENVGFTVRNLKTGMVGTARMPFKTRTEAEIFIKSFNKE